MVGEGGDGLRGRGCVLLPFFDTFCFSTPAPPQQRALSDGSKQRKCVQMHVSVGGSSV